MILFSLPGSCNHDYFRCCKGAREQGLHQKEMKTCCKERLDHYLRDENSEHDICCFRFAQCTSFVAYKPWRAGIEKFGR